MRTTVLTDTKLATAVARFATLHGRVAAGNGTEHDSQDAYLLARQIEASLHSQAGRSLERERPQLVYAVRRVTGGDVPPVPSGPRPQLMTAEEMDVAEAADRELSALVSRWDDPTFDVADRAQLLAAVKLFSRLSALAQDSRHHVHRENLLFRATLLARQISGAELLRDPRYAKLSEAVAVAAGKTVSRCRSPMLGWVEDDVGDWSEEPLATADHATDGEEVEAGIPWIGDAVARSVDHVVGADDPLAAPPAVIRIERRSNGFFDRLAKKCA